MRATLALNGLINYFENKIGSTFLVSQHSNKNISFYCPTSIYCTEVAPVFQLHIWKYIQKLWYLVDVIVRGSVSGLTVGFDGVSLQITCLWHKELIYRSILPFKIIHIPFFPVDSFSVGYLLLAVKTKAVSCKCLFHISFLNTYYSFPTEQIEEVVSHPVKACGNGSLT